MSRIYPLKAVITSNELLAAEYDQNALSAFLTSGALKPSAFESLVVTGARFETVVTVNGEGKDLIQRLKKSNPDTMGKVKLLDVVVATGLVLNEAVRAIQTAINPDVFGMTAAGG
jgi:hypothetical protein